MALPMPELTGGSPTAMVCADIHFGPADYALCVQCDDELLDTRKIVVTLVGVQHWALTTRLCGLCAQDLTTELGV